MVGDDAAELGAEVPAPVRITLDLGLDADGRPAGSVWSGTAGPQSVLGWLELMSELTRLLSQGGTDGGGGTP
ncbi:MAG TPA: hypothetical protein VG346_11230 [Acidimicrobiales bacterium]|nr:hypothetical protein [Acidimicrobiales bacterium]